MQEERVQTCLQRQQLEEDLEQYMGFGKALRYACVYRLAALQLRAQQFSHRFFSAERRYIQAQQRLERANYKPYQLELMPPAVSQRKRVVHAIASFAVGGSQQLIVDIIEGSSDLYEHQFILYNDYEWKYSAGVPITELAYMRHTEEALALFRELKPDIVHVHYWGNRVNGYEHWRWYHQIFEAAFAYGAHVTENCNNPIAPCLHEKIERYAYVSRYAQDYSGIPSPNNRVVYSGSNFSVFTRPEEPMPKDCIGMVYRLDRDKLNVESIDVFIKVIQRRPQTKALIVGKGYYDELYRQKVADAGLADKIEFTGVIPYRELPEYYRRMSVFVAPVHKESFGQVTPFAMNMRIPVAAYEVGALREILVSDDVFAPAGDSDALADTIVRLLDQPARLMELGQFNRERAQRLFSLEAMVQAYREMYAELLDPAKTN
ncbi:glycosyltransferase family 4 protein [Hymenobacter sp. BRD128]|uniref:glycosyltransferase family 4 protein n=1 Tax=Hymenobacter sp. BRD128 TaxID=2675878 RepID=UPI001567910F|nr:glycosyltransferase family 4 protein [Hymenobacter sp. BRD128]QKG55503.1 glycosyltransferase family 4 protein [Hymenobacter sp. BRD128]